MRSVIRGCARGLGVKKTVEIVTITFTEQQSLQLFPKGWPSDCSISSQGVERTCIDTCKYEVVRRTAHAHGLVEQYSSTKKVK